MNSCKFVKLVAKNISLTCISALFLSLPAFSQRTKPLNLPGYDKEKLHFGFSLAVNKADFVLYPAANAVKPDSVLSVESIPDWGFNLGIVSDLRLHDYVTVRFLPALTFQGRIVEYTIDSTTVPGNNAFYTERKKVESTLLDFPINMKIRSERLNNMAAYLRAGGKFSIDLASQADIKNPEILKLNGKDWSLEAGFGLDFYLEYFKLSTEIKFSAGLANRLYREPTPTTYSSPLKKIMTKVWLFSLNFEG
jgi:hypothetical protein